jgi:integrase
MARTVRNQKLDTRSARSRLPINKSGYWVTVTKGCSVGYRKGTKGGVWLAKTVRPGFRRETTLGPADDVLDADGIAALNFGQAQEKARKWFSAVSREAQGVGPATGPYSVAQALADYLADFEQRGGKSVVDAKTRIDALIKPKLGDDLVANLTAKRIRDWHHGLTRAAPRLRTTKGATKPRFREIDPCDLDALRRRKATANRVLHILKAALNHAYREGHVSTDEAWRRVAPFREADAPKVRYLDAEQTRRLVNGTDPEFRPLVQAALLTGCRYGELTALRVADFDASAATVLVRTAKGGKPRQVVLTDEGVGLFRTHTAGKRGDDLIFARSDGLVWGKSHQHRRLRAACVRSKISPAASFHILRHTYATALLRAAVPLPVIAANLGHGDTRMTERHYAHLAPNYVSTAIRASMQSLGIVESSNLVPLRDAAQLR